MKRLGVVNMAASESCRANAASACEQFLCWCLILHTTIAICADTTEFDGVLLHLPLFNQSLRGVELTAKL